MRAEGTTWSNGNMLRGEGKIPAETWHFIHESGPGTWPRQARPTLLARKISQVGLARRIVPIGSVLRLILLREVGSFLVALRSIRHFGSLRCRRQDCLGRTRYADASMNEILTVRLFHTFIMNQALASARGIFGYAPAPPFARQ